MADDKPGTFSVWGFGDPAVESEIELTPENVVCPHHGEPFRDGWPENGFDVFSMALFRSLVNNERFILEHPAGTIQDAIDARPMCELVDRFVLYQAYITCGVGKMDTCEMCGQQEAGTTYTVNTPNGLKKYAHLGFNCVLSRMKPMN